MPPCFAFLNIPEDSEKVNDPDEEVFLCYTLLQTQSHLGSHGLGQYNSKKDILAIAIPLPSSSQLREPEELEVQLAQDTTSLRSRKGDTGSVLWRSCLDFGTAILNDLEGLFVSREALKDATVLELGAGTGLLSILLAPLFKSYTATDLPELVPLIQKNVALNSQGSRDLNSIHVQPLDWLDPVSWYPIPKNTYPDIILATDVTYNTFLLPKLVETFNHLTNPAGHAGATVVVVTELRSHEIVQEFLDLWMNSTSSVRWEIWRVGTWFLTSRGPYVVWAGKRLQVV
ncbi:putative methyltransferase-domain-containing protein [Flagelloscypha sp. PMI_526]|nr:putative methyltransferase-domain-containing protein [Flagelloscypha sp. PMI_526]